jgi:hypothetical protein
MRSHTSVMTEATVKRGREPSLSGDESDDDGSPLMRKVNPQDVEEDYAAIVRYAAAQIQRAFKRPKVEQHTVPPPWVTPLARTDDSQSTHKSAYIITDGPYTYIIPLAFLTMWNTYSTGDNLFVTPVPLRKVADAICQEYMNDCAQGKEPAYTKEAIKLLREVLLESDDAIRMCKHEKDLGQ